MISLKNQAAIKSWEQLSRDMVRVTKDRVRFFGRCCLLLSDFRPRTVNEFYIPARPKGFTRRNYLRLRPSIEFASPSESQEREKEKEKKRAESRK